MKCCSVVFSVTLRLLVTHFVVLSRHQQLRSFAYRDYSVVNLSRFVAAECSALTARTVYSTRLSQANWLGIAISAHPPLEGRGGFPSQYCHDVWYGKTRMVWPPDGEKK